MKNWTLSILMMFVLPGIAAGCKRAANTDQAKAEATDAPSGAPSNRIDVPAVVRQNLGITFAKVERRRVAATLRVPGRFELLPTSRREYRATLSGWVRLATAQFDPVQKDAVIFELDSPDWHRLRKQLHESQAAIERSGAELSVAERSKVEAETALKVVEQRIAELAGAQVRRAELEGELATRRASIPRLEAEIRVKQALLEEARHDFSLEIDAAAALLGMSAKSLTENVEQGHTEGVGRKGHSVQRWYTISKMVSLARGAGVVESVSVSDGAWVEANAVVATVIDPTAIRFRATGLQSDLGLLRDGLTVTVVPPQGSGIDPADVLPGKLKVGLAGDPEQRTIDLLTTPGRLASWARPGVSALLEITADQSGSEELAIPLAAVVKDELKPIFYRRDPNNPDRVIRMEGDLGIDDGKWIVVKSGVKAGDEVVLDGAYELKLAGAGKSGGGKGHFHADGTWHAEPEK